MNTELRWFLTLPILLLLVIVIQMFAESLRLDPHLSVRRIGDAVMGGIILIGITLALIGLWL